MDLFDGFGTAVLAGIGALALVLFGMWTGTEMRNARLRRKLRKEGRMFAPTGLLGVMNQVLNRWF